MVIDSLREQKMRNLDATFFAEQNMEAILNDWGVNGGSFLLIELSPFGKELVEGSGFETVATEDVIAYLGALLNNADWKWAFIQGGKLLDFDGGAQTSHPCSDYQNIILHDLSLCGLGINGGKQPDDSAWLPYTGYHK